MTERKTMMEKGIYKVRMLKYQSMKNKFRLEFIFPISGMRLSPAGETVKYDFEEVESELESNRNIKKCSEIESNIAVSVDFYCKQSLQLEMK